jgi:hypothetical protein
VQRHNIFWGSVLVLLGVLFLLSSLGLITTSVWAVFWPLLLILLGVWFLAGNLGAARSAAESLVVPLKGVEQAHIKVEYGAGELDIRGGAAPDELLSGDVCARRGHARKAGRRNAAPGPARPLRKLLAVGLLGQSAHLANSPE